MTQICGAVSERHVDERRSWVRGEVVERGPVEVLGAAGHLDCQRRLYTLRITTHFIKQSDQTYGAECRRHVCAMCL